MLQHSIEKMLNQVLRLFNINPDYDLNVMKDRQTITEITTKVLKGIEEVIIKEKPHIILVHGDTSTTFAGALAAFFSKSNSWTCRSRFKKWEYVFAISRRNE